MFWLALAIAFFSASQILRYYFSYEDFSLLYGVQFPNDSHSIFLYPGFVAYRFLRYALVPQFHFFGYHPLGYYLVSFLMFLLVIFLFLKFVRILLPEKYKNLSFFATLILASGYVGIEALTWNVAGGQIHLALLITVLVTLIYTILFFAQSEFFFRGRVREFLILVSAFFAAIYFFQFRSYLLFLWVPFLILFKRLEGGKGLSPKLVGGVTILIILLASSFSQSLGLIAGRIAHVNLEAGNLFQVFLQNLGNLLIPSELSVNSGNKLMPGFLALAIFTLPPIYLFLKKRELRFIAIFFSLSTFISLFAIMLVTAFIGQIPTVWPSSHRFYIVLLPFVSGYIAVLLSIFRPRAQIFILISILVTHILFSNKVIADRWESLSRHLRYFYETITAAAPKIDESKVLLTTLTRPYPPGPFVSGSDAGSAHFLAGFYGKRFDEFNLTTEPLEAVKTLLEKKLGPDDIYAFDYKRDDISNETQLVREVLTNGQRVDLGNGFTGSEIEIPDLNISSAVPVFIKAKVSADLSLDKKKGGQPIEGETPVASYFDLFFAQEEGRLKMTASSQFVPLGEEHSIEKAVDGKYDTTWIPQQWGNDDAEMTVDLGQIKDISQIVWSSSRIAPWQFRSPSQYKVETSGDGINFVDGADVDNAPILKTGEFFIVEFDKRKIRYVRILIDKTHGGWPPAIDEVEVFENKMGAGELANYFLVKGSPDLYFPDENAAFRFYQQILKKKIPVEVNWRVDTDGGYLSGQEKVFYIEGLGFSHEYIIYLPKTGRVIKSIRIRPFGFPARLNVSRIEVWQPSLEEFQKNKPLLDMQ